jgi:uncharacterized protein YkwD
MRVCHRALAAGLLAVSACAQPTSPPAGPSVGDDFRVQQAVPGPLQTFSPGLRRESDAVRTRPPWRYRDLWLLRRRWDVASEEEIKRLIDQARALDNNTSALLRNHALQAVARAHSMEMAGRQVASPVKADGTGVTDWVKAAGIPFAEIGVSVHRIGQGIYAAHDTVRDRLDGWLNKPADRVNLLRREFYDVGVGVYRSADGHLYITAVFRRPAIGP